MNCNELDRWLDEGSPEGGRADAIRHAAECARCARAIEAERAIQAALHAEASAPGAAIASAGFVSRVMTRVEEATARAGSLEATRPRVTGAAVARTPWWAVLASDPVSVVSVTLGISCAILSLWHPHWFADAGLAVLTSWLVLAYTVVPPIHVTLHPMVWLSLGIALSPIAAWGIVALYRRLERVLILLIERPQA